MNRKLFLLFFTLFFYNLSFAQSFFITVKDALSKRSLAGVRIEILDKDSAYVDSCEMYSIRMGDKVKYAYSSSIENKSPYFILFCQKDGYMPQYAKVNSADNIEETILLKRAPRTLKEATVTATKVMMVMKGDTIVYNADAFELAEGSMLDQLIRKLPGVKLSRGGVITINGNPVSSLLIDGKDFFKGDANVALENLPAYMVSKIKSYQKIPDDVYISRKDTKPRSDDPWVIDVNLKKEYHTGWFANAEAGGGTDKKYLGKLFGVRFSDRSRVSVYGDINNVNSNQRPGREGNWENEEAMIGENRLIKGGLYAALYGKDDIFKFITTLNASQTRSLDETQSATTNFYNSGNTYDRANSVNRSRAFSFDWEGDLAYRAKFAYITLEQALYHSTNKLNSYSRSQTSTQPLTSYLDESTSTYQDLVSSYTDSGRDYLKSWIYTGNLTMSIKLPHQKVLGIFVIGTYKHQDNNNQSIYNLLTPQISELPDYRNRYGVCTQKSYNIRTIADYKLFERDHNHLFQSLSTTYNFQYERNRGGRDYYRLDHLGGEWAIPQRRTLGWLPSTQDSLAICTDWQNTYFTTDSKTTHTPELRYFMMGQNQFQLSAILPLNFERKHINDLRMQTMRNDFVKHYTLFCPSIDISFRGFQLYGSLTRTSPLMVRMLDVIDNSNPLYVTKGNSALKSEDKHTAFLRYSMEKTKHAQTLQAKIEYSALRNAIGNVRYFDMHSGVTTITPQNVNGNWQINFSGNYARSLDKKQKWTLDLNCGVQYLNSVDFQQTSLMQQDEKSIVKNLFTQGTLTLAYHCKLFNASIKGMLDWQHGTSERADFATINSLDQLYTLTNQWSLPWNINIDTDLTCFIRSGYADASMNSNEWIWNMAISKSMLRGKKLIVKLSGHDILAQRSSVQRTLNAQGRIETWHNIVPRYFMLSLIYRFHKAPKRN